MVTNIPIIASTDILVVGGTTGAVEAALAAKQAGRRTTCITRHTYLGDDICATARLWLDPDQEPVTVLSAQLLGDALCDNAPLRPMHVKYGLEQALVRADVPFLYMTYPVCLLRDTDGTLAGLVVANRSGFQAIAAHAIIDAGEHATVGRMTSATFRPFAPGTYNAERIVVGGEARLDGNTTVQELHPAVTIEDRNYTGHRYTLPIELRDLTPQSLAAAETRARLATWHPDQAYGADHIVLRPTDTLDTDSPLAPGTSDPAAVVAASRCGDDPVYLLGPHADLAHDLARELEKPCPLMEFGADLGNAVAACTSGGHPATELRPDYPVPASSVGSDVSRHDVYFRSADRPSIEFDLNRLPLLDHYTVVVAGGGTAGAPAAIAAARADARTLMLEFCPSLGGVGTEGRICIYYHGNRCGFTSEVDRGVLTMGPEPEFELAEGRWNPEWKKQWFLREAHKAGVDVWSGCLVTAALVDDQRVTGVAVATPFGTGLISAGAVVDATGNADVAAAAGAETVNISKAHVAVQGSGLGPITPGEHYQNTDHTFVDDTDVMDITRAFVFAREKFHEYFDLAQIVDSRQRRQVIGEISLDPLDFLAGRTFPDTVVTSQSNFDSHGFTIHPVFMAKPPDKESLRAHVPLRCLLPVGLDGILVTGLGVSAHRDALPVIRMQPDVQNQGYAAGLAAAMSAGKGIPLRSLDIRALQASLSQAGILDEEVLEHIDSFPIPDSQFADAVATGTDDHLGLAIIFSDPERSLPLLRSAHATATHPGSRLRYAHLLGLLHDDTGADDLANHLDSHSWDAGWNYTGMGQYGFSLSPIDSMLIALAQTGSSLAIPVMLRKASELPDDAEFSHFRAMTLAFEAQPCAEASQHFERLLKTAGGHARASLSEAVDRVPAEQNDTSQRNQELTELLLARGLYACGDPNGLARAVLEAYRNDIHGHYARHARALLASD